MLSLDDQISPRLFEIKCDELIARYNNGLHHFGIEPTKLSSFHIDKRGWSPEIAEEKKDLHYLSASAANAFGLILSPDQGERPVAFNSHSYLKWVLEDIYSAFAPEIADITSTSFLAIDFDPGISAHNNPADLFLLNYVQVHASCGAMSEVAGRQREIANIIQGEGEKWFSQKLRDELIRSAAEIGDLRFRRLTIPDFRTSFLSCYYTYEFGGVFVFGNGRNGLIFEDHEKISLMSRPCKCLGIGHDDVQGYLLNEKLIGIDLDWYRNNMQAVKRILDISTCEALFSAFPAQDISRLNAEQIKRLVVKLPTSKRDFLYQIEEFLRYLQGGKGMRENEIPQDLQLALVRPNPKLPSHEQGVIWALIGRLGYSDPCTLFWADRDYFLKSFKSWTEYKQKWALKELSVKQTVGEEEKEEWWD